MDRARSLVFFQILWRAPEEHRQMARLITLRQIQTGSEFSSSQTFPALPKQGLIKAQPSAGCGQRVFRCRDKSVRKGRKKEGRASAWIGSERNDILLPFVQRATGAARCRQKSPGCWRAQMFPDAPSPGESGNRGISGRRLALMRSKRKGCSLCNDAFPCSGNRRVTWKPNRRRTQASSPSS